MTNTQIVVFVGVINALRINLRANADLYAGDVTLLAIQNKRPERAWYLFNAIPNMIGWDESSRDYFDSAREAMVEFFGEDPKIASGEKVEIRSEDYCGRRS